MCSVKISMYLIYPYSLKKKIHIVINQTGDKKILIKYMLNREDCMQENVCPFHLLIFGFANLRLNNVFLFLIQPCRGTLIVCICEGAKNTKCGEKQPCRRQRL